MKYAFVSFAFIGGDYNEKKYPYRTTVERLKKGDVVVVEGEQGEKILGVFVRYVKGDFGERKSLLKKAHKNTLKSVIKKRVEMFRDIKIPEGMYKRYKVDFHGNKGLEKKIIHKLIIRNLAVSACRTSNKKGTMRNFFGNMQIVVRDHEVLSLQPYTNKIRWVRPKVLEEIAEQILVL